MRVAVTGGCGFIGSHVVDHLVRAGHEVRVIDLSAGWRQSAADYLDADLFDEAALGRALAGCEAVFHLAGAADVNEVAANPVAAVRLNVERSARASRPRTPPWTCAGPGMCMCPRSSLRKCWCTATGRCTASTSPS